MIPSISIVTPSYNHAEFLEATLQSVLNQGFPKLEYIVIDGGSSDGTVEILEHYAERLAWVVSEPDNGQTDAIAKGFSRANGDILAWLNSDDIYLPNTLAEVAAYFDHHPEAKFVYGDGIWMDREGQPLKLKREVGFNHYIWLRDYNYIAQPSAFWRRTLYEEVGGLDRSFQLAMDADLWDRFARVTHPIHVRRLWSQFRYYPEQKNRALREESDTEDAMIRARNGVNTSGLRWKVEHKVAKGMRVMWKVAGGCYGRENQR